MLDAALRTSLLAAACCGAALPAAGQQRIAFVVAAPAAAGWRDLAMLPAVAAATVAGGPAPIVLAVDPSTPWRPELGAFLDRYECDRLVWIGGTMPPGAPAGVDVTTVDGDSMSELACELAERFWSRAASAVVCSFDARGDALTAAVLAGRLRVPLLPCDRDGLDGRVGATLASLGVRELLAVGAAAPRTAAGLRVERLEGAADVARQLAKRGLPTDYVALVQPDDAAAPHARNLAVAAALLAVGRDGVLLPLRRATIWKRAVPTTATAAPAPEGVPAATTSLRRGRIALAGGEWSFVTGRDAGGGPFRAWIDRDGDGGFDGDGEGPRTTGDVVELGGTAFAIDLDADEKARGQSLWLTSPTVDEVRAELRLLAAALKHVPDTLCLVGWPDTLPMAIVGDGQGIDADLVSDLPYAQLDADPFVDLAYARFVAEDLAAATLLASRSLAYGAFRERGWAQRFATAEWATAEESPLADTGLEHAGHHDGGRPIDPASPLTQVGFLLHGSHAMWTELGKTCTCDSDVLLAPCVVESSGCSTAALDLDPTRRSVAARLLRNGAVAFVGNSRRGTARQELFRTELWNALLRGETLGRANRAALNRAIVAALDDGTLGAGLRHYQLHAATVFGDPALDVGLRPAARPVAQLQVRGRRAVVRGPADYRRAEYAPLDEWKCVVSTLTTWRGAMLGVDSVWFGPDRRNEDELWFTAELRTTQRVTGVEPIRPPPAPLGWGGRSYVDEHADGSRSVWWRVRLIDFDMTKGEVRHRADALEFRLRSR